MSVCVFVLLRAQLSVCSGYMCACMCACLSAYVQACVHGIDMLCTHDSSFVFLLCIYSHVWPKSSFFICLFLSDLDSKRQVTEEQVSECVGYVT